MVIGEIRTGRFSSRISTFNREKRCSGAVFVHFEVHRRGGPLNPADGCVVSLCRSDRRPGIIAQVAATKLGSSFVLAGICLSKLSS